MQAGFSLYRALHPTGIALQRISDSATWQAYLAVNPRARLGIRDVGGRMIFVIFHPISKGYEQIFLSAEAAIAFAFDELTAMDYMQRVSDALAEVRESLEGMAANG